MASPSSTPAMRQRTVAEHRWHKAWESLKKEDANEIKLDPTRTDYLDILQDIHNLATKKKEVCIQKACKYKKNNGTTMIIRDLFEKILIWVNKVKDIGDIIVSYDPGHAALPWAAVRLLLTIAVEDSHSFGVLIEGLEQISKLIAQCKVLEDLYSQSAGDDTGFDEALLELYVAILTFESHAIQIYRKSTPSRLISAIKLPSNKLQDGLEIVWVKYQRVTDCTKLIDAQHIRQFENIIRKFEQPIVRSATILQDYQDSLQLQERETLLRWLSTIPYRKHHKLKRSERLEGSCEWLLNSTDYIQWKHSSASSLLWLNGMAGCGKSVLTSAVIESLCQEASSMGTAAPVAYFYCSRNTAEPERANPEEVLRSILEQVSSNTANLPIRKPVVEVYKNLKKDNRGLPPQERLSLDETTEVLLEILQVDPFYVVIDALDECNPNERFNLIESLKTIIDESANVVKVFISSRRDYDIVSQLEESPCISIQPSHISKDIEDYVKKEVSEAIEKKKIVKGKLMPKEKKEIEQKITQVLIEGSQGMFRWVSLQIQQLCRQVKVKRDIDSVLRKLPKSLEESYHLVYQDIMNSEEPSQKVAIRTLQVLLSTRRKLSQEEMIAAVIVDIDTNEILASTVEELLDVCCNLIIFDEGEGILRFAHLSVREFLEKCAPRDCFSIQSTELFMMNRCLYVFLYGSRHTIIFGEQADKITRQNMEFTSYAYVNWPEHCQLAQRDEVTSEFLKEFIGNDLDEGYSASYMQWLKATEEHRMRERYFQIKWYNFDKKTPPSILSISCIYGLMPIIMTLLPYKRVVWNEPISQVGFPFDYSSTTTYPLVCAAERGFDMIVRQFLSRDNGHYAEGSSRHEILMKSIERAIFASRTNVVKTLLDCGMINVNDPTTLESRKELRCACLLRIAVRYDLEEMVKLLLNYGASRKREKWTPHPSYRNRGEFDILGGARILDDQNYSLLEIAVSRCNITIVDALCSYGSDIMARTPSGVTLIHRLVMGHPENRNTGVPRPSTEKFNSTLEHLIGKGLDVAATDNYRWTALHFITVYQYDAADLLLLFINAGTPINAQNMKGDTALSLAAEFAFEMDANECVKILLSQGADPSIVNKNGLTALDQAWKAHEKQELEHLIFNIELLNMALQDQIMEDIWRLFADA
ncbi:hypothetical protein BCIN_11g02450 [Botrytis cinerea B05.10]|uniref:Uncharacterized protein n=1 Tax=Botryotinia fuckeliana (strain B05.10) TaxID=332648 RepID=A0A384JWI1_BOTFB|nr:hypothetical protein BCIN_11g02450 [Botrytis cinerea B05.10]ATZ54933.1 hypothetical protein BCIN_11g02450 [Botrytis cinerea B05.10]